jgi:Kef-type K+ transport system membrane component KefB
MPEGKESLAEVEEPETEMQEAPRPPRRRMALFYLLVAAIVAVGVAISISKGNDREAAPAIGGSYDLAQEDSCLGQSITLKQSGQFVELDNPDDSLSGHLRFKDGRLTGAANCVEGGSEPIDATVEDEKLSGTIADRDFEATFTTPPPAPGTPEPRPPTDIAGSFKLAPASVCMGQSLVLAGDSTVSVTSGKADLGTLSYADDGTISGSLSCLDGSAVTVAGTASDRNLNLALTPAKGTEPASLPPSGEKVVATEQRQFPKTVAAFLIAVVVIVLVARVFGWLATKISQPRVMGEVIAGIVLGPTVFGAIAPDAQALVFPSDIVPIIGVAANLGLIFYMFIVGLELDWGQLRGRVAQAALISNASVALPMVLGIAAAVPVYTLLAPATDFLPFALFMGVSMSITAFPVLARILVERRMLKRPVGAIAMAAAAVDDVSAWFLIALATAIAVKGAALDVLGTVGLALAFCFVMFAGVRPLLARMAGAYREVGRVPGGWIAAIFIGVILSAYATEEIGIAVIFGAFVMGLVMPRHAGLTEDVTRRIEDFVVTLLLPLFFAFTGLRTNMGLLNTSELWVVTAALLGIAVLAKFGSATIAARVGGIRWRPATVIGTLMNTRGLTELIVLNLALEKGVISSALFAALVIMALVTTFMAGPLLRLIDPKNSYGSPLDEELEDAKRRSQTDFPQLSVPDRAILVAPQSTAGLEQLRALAEPLARSEPPRELIIADLVDPPRGAAAGARPGLQTESRLLRDASREAHRVRDSIVSGGVAARAVAFISPNPGRDLSEIAGQENVDLLLVDGRRPLLGEAVPRGPVGTVLREAPCDVGVVVARSDHLELPGADAPVLVPFGAAEHDWAALELGAWICSALGAPLKLLGSAGDSEEKTKLERALADAGMLVRQYAGVASEPVIVEPGRQAILDAADDAGLLVIGLSSRWQQEGLGMTRSHIARAAEAPVLFVRRGTRPSALAPSEDVTRFTWSSPGMSFAGTPGEG